MKHHYELDISTKDCFVDGWDPKAFVESDEGQSYLLEESKRVRCFVQIPLERVFKKEWIDYTASRIADPLYEKFTIFERRGQTRHYSAHVDIQDVGLGQTVKVPLGFNFSSIENDPTDMMWYQDPSEDVIAYAKARENQMDRDELVEVDRCKIPHDRLCLIKTDVIHDIGIAPVDRYCYSLRAKTGRYDWNETIRLYEHLFV